jgi:hypothetical protein
MSVLRIRIPPFTVADPDPRFQIKVKKLKKVLKYAHIPYIFLARHLQIDADPDPGLAYHFKNADPDSDLPSN